MSETFTNTPGDNYESEKAAEEISNASRDRVEDAEAKAKKMSQETPKTPEEMLDSENMDTAPKSKERMKKRIKEKTKAEKDGKKKFEVDLDNYMKFVDQVTSPASKDFNALISRYGELKGAGCDIARLDTAASGICAEGGEFMEIVKKLKFQGKPYDAKNCLLYTSPSPRD